MSHSSERKEKDCLNCGTIVQGRFCHVCGQENMEPKESFWHLVNHFFSDITHFDGKFFSTVKDLLFKPGFLSTEYVKGRRASYLNPIRMYVFTSAIFFIIFFSLFNAEQLGIDEEKANEKLKKTANEVSSEAYKNAKTKEDSMNIARTLALIGISKADKNDTIGNKPKASITFGNTANKYKTIAAYDSAQNSLPRSEKDNWLERQLNRKAISLQQKYGDDKQRLLKDLFEKFIHSFPYMLFVSLPLYALLLKLLYIRRKNFYFADHGIFLVHLYIFTFLFLLLFFVFDKLRNITHFGIWPLLNVLLVLMGVYYAYRAMKNFYKQGAGKTLLKFLLFNFLCLIFLIILFGIFFIFSFYRI